MIHLRINFSRLRLSIYASATYAHHRFPMHTPARAPSLSSRVSYQLINITGSTSNKQTGNYEHRTRSMRRPYRFHVVVNREKTDCRQTVQTVPITCTQVSICRCLSSRFRIVSNATEESLSKNRRVNFAPAFRWFTSRCSRVTTIISLSAPSAGITDWLRGVFWNGLVADRNPGSIRVSNKTLLSVTIFSRFADLKWAIVD